MAAAVAAAVDKTRQQATAARGSVEEAPCATARGPWPPRQTPAPLAAPGGHRPGRRVQPPPDVASTTPPWRWRRRDKPSSRFGTPPSGEVADSASTARRSARADRARGLRRGRRHQRRRAARGAGHARPASSSTCWPAPPGSTGASSCRTSRKPASRWPGSTSISTPAACWCSARARSASWIGSKRTGGRMRSAACSRAICRACCSRRRSRPARASQRSRAGECAAAADGALDADRDRAADDHARRPAGAARDAARRAARHSRPRRLPDGGERHRQERVRARPRRARPSAGRRRHGRVLLPRAGHPDRHVSGADAASRRNSRPRHRQRDGSVRRRPRPDRRSASSSSCSSSAGNRAASTIGSASTPRSIGYPRHARSRSSRCRWRPAATSRCWSKSPRATSCCDCAAGTPRGCWRRGSNSRLESTGRSRRRRRRRGGPVKRAVRQRRARTTAPRDFIVVTGLSGAGKSHAIRALEDLGYFCVDNLPVALIPSFADLTLGGRGDDPARGGRRRRARRPRARRRFPTSTGG